MCVKTQIKFIAIKKPQWSMLVCVRQRNVASWHVANWQKDFHNGVRILERVERLKGKRENGSFAGASRVGDISKREAHEKDLVHL